MPTMMDMGVASPSAQGQATISTATAFTSAVRPARLRPEDAPDQRTCRSRRRSRPARTRPRRGRPAAGSGARLRCASDTMRTIWASSVADPTRRASITRLPVPLSVPPVTARARTLLRRARTRRSPSTRRPRSRPRATTPSTGTFSPGRTRSRSPGATAASGDVAARRRPPRCGARGLRREVEQRTDRASRATRGPSARAPDRAARA